MEVGRAAIGVVIRKENVLLLHSCPAAAKGDALAVIGEEIFPIGGGNPGLLHDGGVAGGIHQNAAGIKPPAGFSVDDHARAVPSHHDRGGNQRVIEDIHAFIRQQFQQGQREHPAGKPGIAALGGFVLRLSLLPIGIEGVEAVSQRKLQKLLRHALDDVFSPAVAQGNPIVDQTGGCKASQNAQLVQKQCSESLPPPGQCRRRTGYSAAADDQIVFLCHGNPFLPR